MSVGDGWFSACWQPVVFKVCCAEGKLPRPIAGAVRAAIPVYKDLRCLVTDSYWLGMSGVYRNSSLPLGRALTDTGRALSDKASDELMALPHGHTERSKQPKPVAATDDEVADDDAVEDEVVKPPLKPKPAQSGYGCPSSEHNHHWTLQPE